MSRATRAALLLLALLPAPAAAQVIQRDEPNRGGEIDLATQDPAIALHRHARRRFSSR